MSEDSRKNLSKPETVAIEQLSSNSNLAIPTIPKTVPKSTLDSGTIINSSSQNDQKDGLPKEKTDLSTSEMELSTSPSPSKSTETHRDATLLYRGVATIMTPSHQALSSSSPSSPAISGKDSDDDKYIDVEDSQLSQPLILMSQTDQHIRQLDRHGELNEVIGSQSMLSQELMYQVSSQQDDVGDEEDSKNDGDDHGDEELDRSTFHLSQQTETSMGMAQRLGLLSQTQDEYDDDGIDEEVNSQGRHEKDPDRRNTATNGHISGLDLLTRAGSDEAANLMSFSQEIPTGVASSRKAKLSDKPLRESEGFGSLLDAVAKITEQEEVEEILTPTWGNTVPSLDHASLSLSQDHSYLDQPSSSTSTSRIPQNKASSYGDDLSTRKRQVRKTVTATQKRKLNESNQKVSTSRVTTSTKSSLSKNSIRKIPLSTPKDSSSGTVGSRKTEVAAKKSPSKRRKTTTTTEAAPAPKVDETEKRKLRMELKEHDLEVSRAQAEAKRAADLAERTISDPVIAKRLLLSMALVRENPRTTPDVLPGPGHVLKEGFFWAHYPPLENVLKRHMMEYYELSTTKCQSAQQQSFNNEMVLVVQAVCESQGWKFADCFDSKGLRDRIRCYYKTHIQNAKKRLRTMVRNPTKTANARHLCEHLDLIEKHNTVSEFSDAHESPRPTKNKQRGNVDHRTINKDEKLPSKESSNDSLTSSLTQTPKASRDDKSDPVVTADPIIRPVKSDDHGSNQGKIISDSSIHSSDRQSASVANGTRRAKRMMNSPLSPLVI